jgi:hypothetical protein
MQAPLRHCLADLPHCRQFQDKTIPYILLILGRHSSINQLPLCPISVACRVAMRSSILNNALHVKFVTIFTYVYPASIPVTRMK